MITSLKTPQGARYQIAVIPQNPILILRKPLDPVIVELLDPEPDNFSHFCYWHEDGGNGDVDNFVPLSPAMESYLLSIQPHNVPLNSERNKLINSDGRAGRPYWYEDGGLVFGNCVIGGNAIRIRQNPDGSMATMRKMHKYPAWDSGHFEMETFVQVDGFKRSMIGDRVSDLMDAGYIGYWYSISPSWKVNRSLGGVADMLNPFWDNVDFPPAPASGASWLPLRYFEGY